MAVKKSDLYSSLWASCDELRGGMDASQYKDYVLFMLFIKYVSDKYADSDDFAPPVTIPPGAGFRDMVALKGKSDIGDRINKDVIQPLIENNDRLARSDFPDFNDPNKLGTGQEMVGRLTNLIAIFERPELDFSKNRAEHDDLLGDAYEYLMRHFATESGKSKGQFYTPSEVSRIIAKVIGISPKNSVASTTVYDPTCGSGSLLLKVAAEAGKHVTLEGQEKDVSTAGLARMNMILHDFSTASVQTGNTLTNPKFRDGEGLRTYDYVVANPPFSDKAWSTGLTLGRDEFQRFAWGEPPAKQGDYAYLLHIIRSLKTTGKGAVILPHGVLFRGNAEAVIRRKLVESGILKGIIGLPANLFYGTGIPACILVLDKENAQNRHGIMMVDASKGFAKDGPKNRLREQDVHRIVDTFRKGEAVPRYARMVPHSEIADPRNDYNLNLPRYIDSSEPEDIQDLQGHLKGGIPNRDIDALSEYWAVMPGLRGDLFSSLRDGYSSLNPELADLKRTILGHTEFTAFQDKVNTLFADWTARNRPTLGDLKVGDVPKELIESVAEDLLDTFRAAPLLDPYAVYQSLMTYWQAAMQDDADLITGDGWVATPTRIEVKDRNGKVKVKDKGWLCELLPKAYIVARFFATEQAELDTKQAELDAARSEQDELTEEHSGEEGIFADLDKVSAKEVKGLRPGLTTSADTEGELTVVAHWLALENQIASLKKQVADLDEALDQKALTQYAKLTEEDVKRLVIDDKWLAEIERQLHAEQDRVSQRLTTRVRELAERYAKPLPALEQQVGELQARVEAHLARMGVQA
ncbi:type I restriction endonuclease subunit M [Deinococcus sp. Arct2-2]|uniref:type I restriction-modification system subunit M n=1 Tax=Deinococcus sp. Arct2-2 TaxID=2568653 RepID=UPI0010A3AB0B|nr:N-6 DNA methylase [Deinococcus sp. Arct2-2]THF70967.1 type I restriction endonuclease subunit M [Deinococcus sp. Arct2-2]